MREWFVSLLLKASGRGLLVRDRLNGAIQRSLDQFCFERERFAVRSGRRELAAVMVLAQEDAPAVLLCHGIGERIEYWSKVQTLLRSAGISSLVFNYTGFGVSRGWGSISQCEEDAVAAFAELKQRCGGPVAVLGYSMGSAVASAIASRVSADGVILCEGFPSLTEAAKAAGVPGWLARSADGIWQTNERLAVLDAPVLVVHSDADSLFPLYMGRKLRDACGRRGELFVARGFEHNQPLFGGHGAYWQPIVKWIHSLEK